MQKKKGKLFACFVDFERAFPSISHSKLWEKLTNIGISSKLIRIFQKLYSNATTSIRTEHGLSPKINITEGLMQGEVLSPILFSLFIGDIEEVLINSGVAGVKLVVNEKLQLLLFADDTVVLTKSAQDLQKKLTS